MSGPGLPGSKTEGLRQAVAEARGESARLAALLALARHFAELSDGVNGLDVARQARTLALRLGDWAAVPHALNSASVSQYHRSDYVGALATAVDAWDSARRVRSRHATAESLYTLGLALHALGEADDGLRICEKGLALSRDSPELRGPHVRLVGLKAMLCFDQGRIEDTERYCAEAVTLSEGAGAQLLELAHGNWGIALLRTAEQRIAANQDPLDFLPRAGEHLAKALELATTHGDERRVADRLSGLGQVALLKKETVEAERLLSDAIRRSTALDYVRTAVMSARYLARLYIEGGELQRAIEVLRVADAQARRGAPVDSRPAIKLMLAGALERSGMALEAERVRAAALELQDGNEQTRSRATGEARQLAARVLADAMRGA